MQAVVGVEGPSRDERRFRSVGEAARMFGVSEMTLYRAIHEGKFPAVRIMGRLIVPLQAIESMAAAAIEDGGLVDATDWVDPAEEESRPVHMDGAHGLRVRGTQQLRGVRVETPSDGQATGNRSVRHHESMRGLSSGGVGQ